MNDTEIAEIRLAPAIAEESPRNERGLFLQGISGNPAGRPPGSRNKLSEKFLADALTVWEEQGIEALRIMAKKEPDGFCRCIASVIPKDFQLNAGGGIMVVKMTDEDLAL